MVSQIQSYLKCLLPSVKVQACGESYNISMCYRYRSGQLIGGCTENSSGVWHYHSFVFPRDEKMKTEVQTNTNTFSLTPNSSHTVLMIGQDPFNVTFRRAGYFHCFQLFALCVRSRHIEWFACICKNRNNFKFILS